MRMKAMSPLLAAIVLVACDAVAPGAPAAAIPPAATVTQGQATAAPSKSHPSGSGAAVAGVTTDANERPLRDSYYECATNNDGSVWDMQGCVETEFEYQDARLNVAYRDVMAKLSDEQKSRLKDEERRWISARDSACSWDAQAEGQARRIEANICALKKTADRAAVLEKALSD